MDQNTLSRHKPEDNTSICDFFSDIVPASPVKSLGNPLSSPCSPPLNQLAPSTETEELASSLDPDISTVSSDSSVRITAMQSQTAENMIVTSLPFVGTGTVMSSQNSEEVISCRSSPPLGTILQTKDSESIVTSSPVAGRVKENVTTVLATPRTSVSPLEKYLMHSAQNKTPTAPKRSVPRARLHTSHKSLPLLEQKENAKEMAILEKRKGRRSKLKRSNKEKKLYSKGKMKELKKLKKKQDCNKRKLKSNHQEDEGAPSKTSSS